MEKKPTQRAFTRADLVEFFNSFWGKQKDPHNEIQSISLLPEIQPGGWEIEYMATWEKGTDYEHTRSYTLTVLQLMRYDGPPYLNLPQKVDLPADEEKSDE
ncbi:MAG TPA: hypothetical protein VKR06_46115 [Ktedonosporobacter sp.]|nr:hypothetical protein [Ktedonosporobacter sp.]